MRKYIFIIFIVVFAAGCKSIELPTIEQSEAEILKSKQSIESSEAALQSMGINLPSDNDIIMRMKMDAIDKALEKLSYHRQDDITLNFLRTPEVYKEEKSVLGLKVTNTLNLDGGNIAIDLKKFRFEKFSGNKIKAIIELEGKGNVSVSGNYSGIPASARPEINLYLMDNITFSVSGGEKGTYYLKPDPKKLVLKAKIAVKLLQWSLPWYQEVPLEIADLIKPLPLPVSVGQEISLPVPGEKPGNVVFQQHYMNLYNSKVVLDNNIIEFKTDVSFRRK